MATRALVLAALPAIVLGTPAAAARAAVDWPTYGFSPDRSGFNPAETAIGVKQASSLRQRWKLDLGGEIDTQPVLASGVRLSPSRTVDLVYAGTERGRFAAVDATTGKLVWRRKLGATPVPGCGDMPNYGITDTAAIDRSRGSAYVAAGDGRAYELDLATGRKKHIWTITSRPDREHVWGALTLAHGILYVPIAGICDFTPYHGRVVAIATAGGKRLATWYVTGQKGPDGGGIWGWGGVSADLSAHRVYAATGNAVTPGAQHSGYAEHVVRLTEDLQVRSSHYPGLPTHDADFGATPLLYRATGCPAQLAVVNKYGSLYVYDRDRLVKGPVQRVELGGSVYAPGALIGVPAYWPAKRTLYVTNPLPHGVYRPGVVAFRVSGDCRLSLRWQADGHRGTSSSPTVAGGVVYYGDGAGGRIVALDARTGHRLWTTGKLLGGHPIFNAPSVVNGTLYAGAWDGFLRAFRP